MKKEKRKQTFPNNTGKKRRLSELVRDQIIADIISSDFNPGDSYATEEELTQRFGVSRNTLRKAMGELEKAGYLIRRQRVGTIVTAKAASRNNITTFRDLPSRGKKGRKVIFILPRWEAITGNFFSNVVIREINNSETGEERINVEIRLFDDPMDEISDDVFAIITVDPAQELFSKLAYFNECGIEIIAIESQTPLFMAKNIRFDAFNAAYESVKLLHKNGCRSIALYNQGLVHDTFRQWLEGYLAACRKFKIPILPHSIIQVIPGNPIPKVILDGIDGWVCSFDSAVGAVSHACSMQKVKIPEEVAVIGTDDPGDNIIFPLGCKLTVVRPDFENLGQTVRKILDKKIIVNQGEIITRPMKWIHRESSLKGKNIAQI